jgi:GNAT superfamily N-acetyltransferase
MTPRPAGVEDVPEVAAVHADSWRTAYRGALSDEFLDGDILRNRLELWQARLSAPSPNQLVLVAEHEGRIAGFACAYGADDQRWGTLLDNLHVRRELHGRGIGRQLMVEVAAWNQRHYPDQGIYLWVLEQNQPAQGFYRRLGAFDAGGDVWAPPGGGSVPRRRYAWSAPGSLLGR